MVARRSIADLGTTIATNSQDIIAVEEELKTVSTCVRRGAAAACTRHRLTHTWVAGGGVG